MSEETQKSASHSETDQIPQRAYFATGCFWGAERRFWSLPGVVGTTVGYMGGTIERPSYEQVCTGKTGHAEVVEVAYLPSEISYVRLLEEFWTMHDPTSLNQQGGDIGTQYRSAIYTTSPEQMIEAVNTRDAYEEVLLENGMAKICTEILDAEKMRFWLAEDYHQRYLEKNPQGYDCHSSTGVPFPAMVVAAAVTSPVAEK